MLMVKRELGNILPFLAQPLALCCRRKPGTAPSDPVHRTGWWRCSGYVQPQPGVFLNSRRWPDWRGSQTATCTSSALGDTALGEEGR